MVHLPTIPFLVARHLCAAKEQHSCLHQNRALKRTAVTRWWQHSLWAGIHHGNVLRAPDQVHSRCRLSYRKRRWRRRPRALTGCVRPGRALSGNSCTYRTGCQLLVPFEFAHSQPAQMPLFSASLSASHNSLTRQQSSIPCALLEHLPVLRQARPLIAQPTKKTAKAYQRRAHSRTYGKKLVLRRFLRAAAVLRAWQGPCRRGSPGERR